MMHPRFLLGVEIHIPPTLSYPGIREKKKKTLRALDQCDGFIGRHTNLLLS